MLSIYPAIFYKEKNYGYSVIFPDLNHLATCGNSLNEAMEMAVDCLAGYIYSARLEGEKLPEPTAPENVDIHCEDDEYSDYESAFLNMVPVDVDAYAAEHFEKAVKKTLTVPEDLNQIGIKKGINFSAILKDRLMKVLGFKDSETAEVESSFPVDITLGGRIGALIGGAVPLLAGGGALSELDKIKSNSKTVKKTVTIPKWLNDEAVSNDVNFSAELKAALVNEIKKS